VFAFQPQKKLFLISSISNDEIILKAESRVTFVASAYLHTFTKRGKINKPSCHFLSPQRLLIGCDVMIRGYKFLSLCPRQREIAQTRVYDKKGRWADYIYQPRSFPYARTKIATMSWENGRLEEKKSQHFFRFDVRLKCYCSL
jgi:hypothetical protein